MKDMDRFQTVFCNHAPTPIKMAALRVSLAVACAAAVVSRAAAVHRQVYSTEPAATIGYNKQTGKLKILQFADMHYENGASTKCSQIPSHADWPCVCDLPCRVRVRTSRMCRRLPAVPTTPPFHSHSLATRTTACAATGIPART